jgi:hypothetical protein
MPRNESQTAFQGMVDTEAGNYKMICPECGYEDHEDQFEGQDISTEDYCITAYFCPECYFEFEIEE